VFLRRVQSERSQDFPFRFISGGQTFLDSADRQKGHACFSGQLGFADEKAFTDLFQMVGYHSSSSLISVK
jgi:hypothetical protein